MQSLGKLEIGGLIVQKLLDTCFSQLAAFIEKATPVQTCQPLILIRLQIFCGGTLPHFVSYEFYRNRIGLPNHRFKQFGSSWVWFMPPMVLYMLSFWFNEFLGVHLISIALVANLVGITFAFVYFLLPTLDFKKKKKNRQSKKTIMASGKLLRTSHGRHQPYEERVEIIILVLIIILQCQSSSLMSLSVLISKHFFIWHEKDSANIITNFPTNS